MSFYPPNDESTCLSSAPEMKPCPSLSKVLKASMKSAKVPVSFSLINSVYTGMNSSNLYAFSPVMREREMCDFSSEKILVHFM